MGLLCNDMKGTAGGLFKLKLGKPNPKEVNELQVVLFLRTERFFSNGSESKIYSSHMNTQFPQLICFH